MSEEFRPLHNTLEESKYTISKYKSQDTTILQCKLQKTQDVAISLHLQHDNLKDYKQYQQVRSNHIHY